MEDAVYSIIYNRVASYFDNSFSQEALTKMRKDIMRTHLRKKCSNCSHWNRFEVEKMLLAQLDSELEVEERIPYYLPLKEEKCSKCSHVIAQEKS